jgi:hypothetical protein
MAQNEIRQAKRQDEANQNHPHQAHKCNPLHQDDNLHLQSWGILHPQNAYMAHNDNYLHNHPYEHETSIIGSLQYWRE